MKVPPIRYLLKDIPYFKFQKIGKYALTIYLYTIKLILTNITFGMKVKE